MKTEAEMFTENVNASALLHILLFWTYQCFERRIFCVVFIYFFYLFLTVLFLNHFVIEKSTKTIQENSRSDFSFQSQMQGFSADRSWPKKMGHRPLWQDCGHQGKTMLNANIQMHTTLTILLHKDRISKYRLIREKYIFIFVVVVVDVKGCESNQTIDPNKIRLHEIQMIYF